MTARDDIDVIDVLFVLLPDWYANPNNSDIHLRPERNTPL
jgi:hypothetical protein